MKEKEKFKLNNKYAVNFHLLKEYYKQDRNRNYLSNNEIMDIAINDVLDINKKEKINWTEIKNLDIAYYYYNKADVFFDEEILETKAFIELKNTHNKGTWVKTVINDILLVKILELQQNNVMAQNWVKKWLRYCEKNDIYPWKFDFKQCFLKDEIKNTKFAKNRIKLFQYYKSKSFKPELNKFNLIQNVKNPDCDKEAFPFYKVLGWQKSINNPIRGDTINSFATTFNSFRSQFKNSRDQDNDESLFSKLEEFACLTHSIGNFTVLPSWINQGRGVGTTKDYWDLTLNDLHKFHMLYSQENTSWKAFIEKFYLQPYVVEDEGTYKPQPLWNNHFSAAVNPEKIVDFKQFYSNVNLLIKERGKWITKILCEQLRLTDLNFYIDNHLDQMEKIRFFNEIITTEK